MASIAHHNARSNHDSPVIVKLTPLFRNPCASTGFNQKIIRKQYGRNTGTPILKNLNSLFVTPFRSQANIADFTTNKLVQNSSCISEKKENKYFLAGDATTKEKNKPFISKSIVEPPNPKNLFSILENISIKCNEEASNSGIAEDIKPELTNLFVSANTSPLKAQAKFDERINTDIVDNYKETLEYLMDQTTLCDEDKAIFHQENNIEEPHEAPSFVDSVTFNILTLSKDHHHHQVDKNSDIKLNNNPKPVDIEDNATTIIECEDYIDDKDVSKPPQIITAIPTPSKKLFSINNNDEKFNQTNSPSFSVKPSKKDDSDQKMKYSESNKNNKNNSISPVMVKLSQIIASENIHFTNVLTKNAVESQISLIFPSQLENKEDKELLNKSRDQKRYENNKDTLTHNTHFKKDTVIYIKLSPMRDSKKIEEGCSKKISSDARCNIKNSNNNTNNLSQKPQDHNDKPAIRSCLRRKRDLFEITPKYLPNKKLCKSEKTDFYQSKVKLYDKLNQNYYEFRVFKENDLCYNAYVQKTLKETRIDDDCPTDSEQIDLAINHGKKHLKEALSMQKASKVMTSTSSSSLSSSSSYSHYEKLSEFSTPMITTSKSLTSEDLMIYDSEELNKRSKEKKWLNESNFAKKLDFNIDNIRSDDDSCDDSECNNHTQTNLSDILD